jgi:hypothetical protein
MKASSFLIGFSTLTIVLLIAPVTLRAQGGQSGPCSCADKADLIDQLNKASAAMNTISNLLQTLSSQNELVETIPTAGNPNKMSWKEIIDAVVYQSGYLVSDASTSKSCEFKALETTACMKSLSAKLAPYRKDLCTVFKFTVGQYLLKLSEIYRKDIAEILARLSAVEKKCRPTSWFGTIRYSFVQSDQSTTNRPPAETHTIEDSLKIDGIIRLDGDYALEYPSNWESGGKYDENKISNGPRPCTGGLATAKMDGNYKTTYIFRLDKSAPPLSKNTEVAIGEPDQGKIPIGFWRPKFTLNAVGFIRRSYTSDCPTHDGEYDGPSEPYAMEIPLDAERINFDASYFPGSPEKISGTSIIESGKTVNVKVTYNLYKLKP